MFVSFQINNSHILFSSSIERNHLIFHNNIEPIVKSDIDYDKINTIQINFKTDDDIKFKSCAYLVNLFAFTNFTAKIDGIIDINNFNKLNFNELHMNMFDIGVMSRIIMTLFNPHEYEILMYNSNNEHNYYYENCKDYLQLPYSASANAMFINNFKKFNQIFDLSNIKEN